MDVQKSFLISYLVLMGYTVITFVEAIRTPIPAVRHIMNIETTVSVIASLAYTMFLERLEKPSTKLSDITDLRYLDWTLTTPLILLALLLFYTYPAKPPHYGYYALLVLLNGGMLATGYAGETKMISKELGGALGFVFFALLLASLYLFCIPVGSSYTVFGIFAAIWSLYGVAYYLEDETQKNVSYNALDVISKALFGFVLWLYFGKVLRF